MVLIALFAPSGSSQWHKSLCEKAKNYLDSCNLCYKVVNDETTRGVLFSAAKMPPSYPQFFLQVESTDQIIHLGKLDAIECLVDRKSPLLEINKSNAEDRPISDTPANADPTLEAYPFELVTESLASSPTGRSSDACSGSDPDILTALDEMQVEGNDQRADRLTRSSKTYINALIKGTTSAKVPTAVPITHICNSVGLARGSDARSASNVTTSLSHISLSDKKSASEKRQVSSIKVPWPPNEHVTTARASKAFSFAPTHGRLIETCLEEKVGPVLRLPVQNSLRPSTMRGNSFDDDGSASSSASSSSWRSDVAPDFNLRPSVTRGHSFDHVIPEKPMLTDSPTAMISSRHTSMSLDFTNHEVGSGATGSGVFPQAHPRTIKSIEFVPSTSRLYRPTIGRDGSFNKPLVQEVGTDVKIQVERGSANRNTATAGDYGSHSKSRNDMKLDPGASTIELQVSPSA